MADGRVGRRDRAALHCVPVVGVWVREGAEAVVVAAAGANVHAATDGVTRSVDADEQQVVLESSDGALWTYGGVEAVLTRSGHPVVAGEPIGVVAAVRKGRRVAGLRMSAVDGDGQVVDVRSQLAGLPDPRWPHARPGTRPGVPGWPLDPDELDGLGGGGVALAASDEGDR